MIKGAKDGSERSTVTELAARLRLAQTTTTELVRRAEEAGLVTREQSETGRSCSDPPPHTGRRARLARSFHANTTERKRLRELVAQVTY